MASESPRLLSSRTVSSACWPDEALSVVYCSRYRLRRSLRTAASTCGSSSTTRMNGLFTNLASPLLLNGGQRDAELRPSRPRLDGDLSVVVADQPPDDVEPEPHSAADGLGREERVENAFANLIGDARPVISDPHHDALALAGYANVDTAGVGNRIERVVDQIGPYLIELAGKAEDVRQIRFDVDVHRHGLVARLRSQHRHRVVNPTRH